MNDERFRVFLEDTLALWRVEGTVEPGALEADTQRTVAVVQAADGTTVCIERGAQAMPFRWLVRTRRMGETDQGSPGPRPRTCASVVGLLNALRLALDVERAEPLRVAPPAPDA